MQKPKYYSISPNTQKNQEKFKAIICIGGGSGWCMAYWGALLFLIQQNVVPVGFVTRSSGGFVALSYAFGWSDKESRDYYRGFKLSDYLNSKPRVPLFDVDKYKTFTGQYSKDMKLEELKVPIYMVSANYTDGNTEYLHKDVLVTDALTATTAIPGLIGPVSIGLKKYLDGDIVPGNDVAKAREIFGNYPVIQMEKGESGIITSTASSIMGLMQKVFRIRNESDLADTPDYTLGIKNLKGSPFSTEYIDFNVEKGYKTARRQWSKIKSKLKRFK